MLLTWDLPVIPAGAAGLSPYFVASSLASTPA